MTNQGGENHLEPGESLEESRSQILATAPVFPGHDALVIDGLTDEEQAEFLAAIARA